MKNGLLIFNVVLLVLVGILFYLHFSATKGASAANVSRKAPSEASAQADPRCSIAYFEMDSIENSFVMVKDVKSELGKKEDQITNELTRMEKEYRNKAARYQAQAVNMNQTQSELAQRDMMETQQRMQARKQMLDQEYQDLQMRKLKDVRSRIEEFLADYNKSHKFSYIVSYEPGLFYYKDTMNDITVDVIKGLNEAYKKKN